ncbi:cysteine synthase A [Sporomusa aerivorans]|uniref:cysteine synthase A n=1 Tax=Sporomusa aerivorans TaxID=204936 RepID=UPI00352B85FA
MKIAEALPDLIGNTPLLRLNNFSRLQQLKTPLVTKLEYFNPQGSVKDRLGYALIKDAEERGLITKDTTIIESTSGNTGVGLASVAAARGYRLIITMPDNLSEERVSLLKALGAEVVLTPASGGMKAAIAKAEELVEQTTDAYMPHQFKNPANTDIHRSTTAEEIWRDTEGQVDIFVAGIGTGGTITGIGEVLKARKSSVQVIGVEPCDSPVLSQGSEPRPHQLQGIGISTGFIPHTLNIKILDEIILVKTEEAYRAARQVARSEGILVGISSGAAIHAATQAALRPENQDKLIVVLAPDTGWRYLSTPLYRE